MASLQWTTRRSLRCWRWAEPEFSRSTRGSPPDQIRFARVMLIRIYGDPLKVSSLIRARCTPQPTWPSCGRPWSLGTTAHSLDRPCGSRGRTGSSTDQEAEAVARIGTATRRLLPSARAVVCEPSEKVTGMVVSVSVMSPNTLSSHRATQRAGARRLSGDRPKQPSGVSARKSESSNACRTATASAGYRSTALYAQERRDRY